MMLAQVRPGRRHGGVEQGLEPVELLGCLEHGPSPAPGCAPDAAVVRCWGHGGRTRPDPPGCPSGACTRRRNAPGRGRCAAVVRHYVGYEEWPESAFLRREVARRGVALILGFGDAMEVFEGEVGSPARTLGAFVVGNQARSSLTGVGGPPARACRWS